MNNVSDVIISHNGTPSLHVQLHNQLRQLIVSGHWPHGTRIPSETELAQHLRISRSTVRLALHQTEIEGLIERIVGRGTFVAYPTSSTYPSYSTAQGRESRLIAFLTSSFDAESHLMMLKGAENTVKAHGYQITFNHVQTQQEEIDLLLRMREDEVAGVLLWPNAAASRALPGDSLSYQRLRVPLVLLDRQVYSLDCDCVTSDNYGGARAAMEHLIELGHRQIAFLSHHEMDLLPVKERYRAYRDSMQDAGLTPLAPWLIGQPGNEIDAIRSSIDVNSAELQQIKACLLSAMPRPTAILGLHDYLAVLAVRAIQQLDLRVPDHISVAGFDDTDPAVLLEVPLTTVAQDPFTIGKEAARLLIERIEGASVPARLLLIPTQLRVRSSTAMPVLV